MKKLGMWIFLIICLLFFAIIYYQNTMVTPELEEYYKAEAIKLQEEQAERIEIIENNISKGLYLCPVCGCTRIYYNSIGCYQAGSMSFTMPVAVICGECGVLYVPKERSE